MKTEFGTKVQRKGSTVIWTVVDGKSTDAEMVYLRCAPKNRTAHMYKWIDMKSFNKDWLVIA